MTDIPMGDTSRDGSATIRACPVCATALASARARYCSHACRQRAYRLSRLTPLADTAALTSELRRRRTLVAHTIYACPECDTRFLGTRRCDQCNLFCRALGLGGACPDCDTIILLAELLAEEVPT